MRSTRTRPRIAAPAVALTILLAACGQGDPAAGPGGEAVQTEATEEQPPEGAADEQAAGAPDEADIEFVQGMVPHHEGAIEMSELVEGRTDRQELIDLADEIIAVQDAEISMLRGMLDRMGADEMAMDEMGDMDHGDMGMMDDAAMEELRELEAEQFDRRFLEAMIVHHEGAIDMAERVLAAGQDTEVAGLAEAVIAAQEAEIEQMRTWLDEWDLD
jgi:uncharacterized protein (DUF305 family)